MDDDNALNFDKVPTASDEQRARNFAGGCGVSIVRRSPQPCVVRGVMPMRRAALFLSVAILPGVAFAQVPPQNSRPSAIAKVDTIPPPRDVPYPGTLQLTVDASDVTRGIFRVHERVPVTGAGDLVLLSPKWLPGHHSPSGEINKVAGFRATAGGRALKWVRDRL